MFSASDISMHATRPKEGWLRISIGFVLNAVLWPLTAAAARWGNYDREAHLALINIAVAAAALVTVIPLFWRGKPWQVPLAFILLWLPVLVLYNVVCRISGFKNP